MLKSPSLCLLFIAICSCAIAQTLNPGWGDLNKNEKKLDLITTVGSLDDGLYSFFASRASLFSAGSNHVFIEKYTGKAQVAFNKELIIPTPKGLDKDVKFSMDRVLFIKGTIYLFSTFYNKNTDTRYLFVNTISKDGVVNDDMRELDEIKDVKKREGGYTTIVSDDSTKIGIYNFGAYEKKANQKIIMHVIDLQMADVWNKEMVLPYTDKDCDVDRIKIDNTGNAVISAKIKLHGEEAKGKFDYKYILMYYNHEAGEPKEYSIDLGDKYMGDFYFTIDNDNNIRATGFYAYKKNDYINGYFYLTIDSKSQTITSKIVKDFDANFLQNFPKKKDLRNVRTQRLFVSDNGTLNIVAEQNFFYEVCYTDKYGSHCTPHYVSNNIIVINLTKDGKYNWSTVVHKTHDLTIHNGVESVIMHHKNSLFFVYNEPPGNSKKEDRKLKTYRSIKKTEITLVKVDENGKITKQLLDAPETKKKNKTYIDPYSAVQLANNQYAVYCYVVNEKSYRIGFFDIQ